MAPLHAIAPLVYEPPLRSLPNSAKRLGGRINFRWWGLQKCTFDRMHLSSRKCFVPRDSCCKIVLIAFHIVWQSCDAVEDKFDVFYYPQKRGYWYPIIEPSRKSAFSSTVMFIMQKRDALFMLCFNYSHYSCHVTASSSSVGNINPIICIFIKWAESASQPVAPQKPHPFSTITSITIIKRLQIGQPQVFRCNLCQA